MLSLDDNYVTYFDWYYDYNVFFANVMRNKIQIKLMCKERIQSREAKYIHVYECFRFLKLNL